MKLLSAMGLSLVFASSVNAAQAPKAVDISNDGIFTALTSTRHLQKTVDTLIANGANGYTVVSIAAAAGIAQSKIMKLQVCTHTVSDDVTVLSATCMRPKTVMTAYQSGLNDPLSYLPATAAGNKEKK